VRSECPTAAQREVARRYVEPLERRDFAAPREPRYRPLALSVLRIEDGRVVEVIDLGRPEPFDVFGPPMSFAPPRRPNEDEVNPKEVR